MSSSTGTPDVVPLTGSDCFLRAFDDEVRRYNGASHVSQLVLRLGPGFDVDTFRALIARMAAEVPMLRAPIRRRFAVGLPVYQLAAAERAPAPAVHVHELAGPPAAAPPALLAARINDRFVGRDGRLLCFDVVRYDGGARGTDLGISWLHMLFDGAGSETFVQQLDECFRGVRRAGAFSVGEAVVPGGTASERGHRANEWRYHVAQLAKRPPRSLAGPLRRVPQALRYEVDVLDAAASARAFTRAREYAGALTPMLFYLAVTMRAHAAIFRARGLDPGTYVVPLPVNLHPKGADRPVFRSHVSLIWFQVTDAQTADLAGLVAELKAQRRTAIKEGLVEGGVQAMHYVRWLPRRLYARMTRRSLGGELCTFFFAFTGELAPGLNRFLGAEIAHAFHVPAVPPSPGSCVAMSIRRGRLGITHVYQDGVVSADERALLRARLRDDLTGTAT